MVGFSFAKHQENQGLKPYKVELSIIIKVNEKASFVVMTLLAFFMMYIYCAFYSQRNTAPFFLAGSAPLKSIEYGLPVVGDLPR